MCHLLGRHWGCIHQSKQIQKEGKKGLRSRRGEAGETQVRCQRVTLTQIVCACILKRALSGLWDRLSIISDNHTPCYQMNMAKLTVLPERSRKLFKKGNLIRFQRLRSCTRLSFPESQIRMCLVVTLGHTVSWWSCCHLCRHGLGSKSWHSDPTAAAARHIGAQNTLTPHEEAQGVLVNQRTFCGHLLVRSRKC